MSDNNNQIKTRLKAYIAGMEPPILEEDEVDEEELELGIEWENEHTDNREIAKIIALHHIEEHEDYYSKYMKQTFPEEYEEVNDRLESKD